MNWFQWLTALLPIIQEILTEIGKAQTRGVQMPAIHEAMAFHVAALPAKIREL